MIDKNSMTKNDRISNFIDTLQSRVFLTNLSQKATLPFLLLIIGIFATSSNSIFLKLALNELNVEAILFDRLLIATIAFSTWNFISQPWQSRSKEKINIIPAEEESDSAHHANQVTLIILGWIILLVIIHTTGRFLYLWSLQRTTAVNALTLSNLTPIFTFLGAWLFAGKQFNYRFLIGLAIAVGGGIFLTLEDWLHVENQSFGTMAILGDGAALLCAIVYSIAMLITEKLLKKLPDITFLVWRCAVSLVFIAPFVWIKGYSIFPTTITGWLAILGLGLICEVISRRLVAHTFKYFSAAFLTIVFLLEPFPVAFFAWIFLGEALSPFNIMGFILIFTGIYLAKTGKGSQSVEA